MDYKNALKAAIEDLETYDRSDLMLLAKHYGVQGNKDLCEKLAARILKQRMARMPPEFDEEWEFVEAVAGNDLDTAKKILDSGKVDPEAILDNRTLLMHVVDNLEAVNMLLKAGAEPEQRNKYKETALMKAASAGNLNVVKVLLETGRAIPGAYANNGWTALNAAIDNGQVDIVQELLKPDYIDQLTIGEGNELDSRSPLQIAVHPDSEEPHNPKIIDMLLKTGKANPGHKDEWEYTALMYAVGGGDPAIIKTLLATGAAKPAERNKEGDTALMLAVKEGNLDIVKTLLATGAAKPAERNKAGDTALMLAAEGGNLDIIKALLATGEAKPGAQNNDGDTALMFASLVGSPDIVKALLATGEAKPSARNKKDETALTMVRSSRDKVVRTEHPRRAEFVERYDEIKRMLVLVGLLDIPKKKLPPPKEAPLWMHLCAKLETAKIETLQRLARDLDIDTKDAARKSKDKRRLCYDLAMNYEELLKIEGAAPAEVYEHIGVECDNDTTLGGEEWPEIPPEDLFVDKYNYCFSFDDLEGILAADGRHPFTRIPMADVQLKDGTSLLAAFEARKKTRAVGIEEERLKKMRQVHTLITNPIQAIKNRLAEMLDEHPGGPGQRNYFEVVTLDDWEKKTTQDYQQFLTALRNEELIQDNEPVLDTLAKLSTPSFSELLEALIQSIKVMPEDNKQTYRLLLKIMLEE